MIELFENEGGDNSQQKLLDAIWRDESSEVDKNEFTTQGIDIYRRNLFANAQRALSISFPTVFELLDSNISKNLVYQFLRVSPPSQGDWGQWGAEFSPFISSIEIGYQYPYLADCAKVDWHVHCALHGIDQSLEQLSLQHLANSEPENIEIVFNQNVTLVKTQFPLTEIFQAHHHDDEIHREVAMSKAKKILSTESVEQIVMIYRPEFKPEVSTLSDSEGAFILSLLSGNSLEQALNVVKDESDFSFEQWLLTAIERNLINYFKEK